MRRVAYLTTIASVLFWSAGLAYVQSRPTGFPISWNLNCLRVHLSEAGSEDVSLEVLESVINDSMLPWNEQECTGLELIYEGTTQDTSVGFSPDSENVNLIVFRDEMAAWIHPADVLALTTLTFCSDEGGLCEYRGQVIDGDIEFNGGESPFSASEGGAADRHDLANTLTHELGHFIGLDHSLVEESTMYFSAPLGETSKRTLHRDDVAGICAIYADCLESPTCGLCGLEDGDIENAVVPKQARGCGCTVTSTPFRDASLFLLIALVGYGVRPSKLRR